MTEKKMTEEELKNKCKERAKIFQQAMESCKSSNPIDCIEWFADRIAELEVTIANLKEQVQSQVEATIELDKEKAELIDEVKKLKILISSLVYEINQIWDINEMNDDLRMCAEKIDREVQLSKMADDNRMVISALGFAIVPPKPKLDVKEIKEND